MNDYYFLLESTKQGLFWDTIDYNSQIYKVHFYLKNNTDDTVFIKYISGGDGAFNYYAFQNNYPLLPDSILKIKIEPYGVNYLQGEYRKNPSIISYQQFSRRCFMQYIRNEELISNSISSWGVMGPCKDSISVKKNSDSTLNNTKSSEPKNNQIIQQKKDTIIDVKTNNIQTYKSDTAISEFNSPTQIDSNLLAPRMAYFIGGETALLSFINNNFNQSLIKKVGVTGTIYASIIIDKTGKVIKCEIVKSLHPELDAELIRVLYLMPNWIPGVCDPEILVDPEEDPNYDGSYFYCKQKVTIPFQIK